MEKLYKLAMKAEKDLELAGKQVDRLMHTDTVESRIDYNLAKKKMLKSLHYLEGLHDAIEAAGLTAEYYQYKRTH